MNTPEELLARASAGDEAAWRQLVARYQALVYQVIRAHRIPPEEGEDLFQEVFLRLHRHAGRIRDAAALTRWVAVTTRNLCLDGLARKKRERGRPDPLANQSDPAPVPEDLFHRSEEAQHVREALETLSERCRELLRILYYESDAPDYRLAADRLGMPLGSVGPTRQRCLERLLGALERGPMYSDPPLRRPVGRKGA